MTPKTNRYAITEKAGPYVAGFRNNGVGTILELTPRQAEQAVRDGTLIDTAKATKQGRAAAAERKAAQAEADKQAEAEAAEAKKKAEAEAAKQKKADEEAAKKKAEEEAKAAAAKGEDDGKSKK